MHVALVQMHCPKGEIDANLATIARHIGEAAARGADVICFPEMSITGYINPERWPEAVLRLDGPEVARLVELTAGKQITAVTGLVEANPTGKPYITQIAARGGELLGAYRKRTIPPDEAPWFAPGPPTDVFPNSAAPFGLAVCADIDFPELFAEYARRGASLVFEAAAPGLYGEQATRNWQSGFDWWRGECHTKLGRYAREHGIVIAVATQAGRTVDEDFPGGGYLFGPDGACLAETPDWRTGVLYADVAI